jgi:hypothetical protein
MVSEADYQEAIEFVDLADNPEAIAAIKGVFSQVFQGEHKKKLWGRLSPQQRCKLINGDNVS